MTETAVFFTGEEDRSTVARTIRVDETCLQVLFNKLPKSCELFFGDRIYMTDRRFLIFKNFDSEVELAMQSKIKGFFLRKDIRKIMIFGGKTGKVRSFGGCGTGMSLAGGIGAQRKLLSGRVSNNGAISSRRD